MQYCIYLRKSRADEELERIEEGETLERHRRTLIELAKRKNLPIVKIYEEIVSGESIASRPQMQALLSDVERGMYGGVLVMEVERLARGDTMDQGLVAQTFKYSGTLIITPIKTYDPNNEFDEEYFEFGLFMSRREYKTINRRLQRGREASAREGKFLGSRAPYGYERVKIEGGKGCTLKPIPEQAKVVRMIFEWYTEGMKDETGETRRLGIQAIARRLNSLGIPCTRSDYWEKATIRDMLLNPAYAGRIRWGWRKSVKKITNGKSSVQRPWNYDDSCIVVPGLHEAVVPPEMFDRAQKYIEERPPAPVGYKKQLKNPLAGLIICGKCGRKMVIRKASMKGKPDYLVCNAKSCNNVSTPLHLVEERMLKTLREWVDRYSLRLEENKLPEIENKTVILRNVLDTANKNLITLKKQLNSAYDFFEQKIYTVEQFTERSKMLSERIEETKKRIENLNGEIQKTEKDIDTTELFLPKVKHILEIYNDTYSAGEKNGLLKEIVEKAVYIKEKSGAFRGVTADDFELSVFPLLPNQK